LLGAFLSLMAAMMFALNNATTRRGVLTGTVSQAMAITVPMGVPLFFLLLLAFGQLDALTQLSWTAIGLLSIAGVLHFVWGRYCNYRASKAIGTNLQGPASQSDIVFTLALAMWLLDEKLTPLRVLGIALVIGGPLVTMVGDLRAARAMRGPSSTKGFQPVYAEGYLFAVLSGTGYGLSPIFVRLALRDTGLGIGGGLAGAFVSYVAAACVVALLALAPGQIAHVRKLDRRTRNWFIGSGLTVMLSQMFRYLALSVAPVSVVQPIQRLSLIFRFFFSYMLNREHEVFGGKVWVSTGVALMGALLLSLSAEQVTALLPLPEWLADLAKIEWP
jgi:drug/metabolite transporter (DMT)-like permease